MLEILAWTLAGALLLAAGVLALAAVGYWFRGTPLRTIRDLDGGLAVPPVDRPDFLSAVKRHLDTTISPGHRVEVLFDGEETYPRLFEDLGPRPTEIYKLNQRSHVRAVIVDGRVAWTGGFAIADPWRGDGRSPDSWRDTNVRFEGPAVHQLQAAFAAEWVEATGELLVGPRVFPGRSGAREGDDDRTRGGDLVAGLFHSAPSLGGTMAERSFALSIGAARETCWITSGYFVPDTDFRDMLRRRAREGVDVRVLHPGANTDRIATWYAARRWYEELLESGVRIWEYRPTMVHAKTVVVDRTWCAVGTTNFDNRSMALNDEVTLLVRDAAVAGCIHDRFLEDLEHADEVDLERFRARGPGSRAAERLAGVLSRVL